MPNEHLIVSAKYTAYKRRANKRVGRGGTKSRLWSISAFTMAELRALISVCAATQRDWMRALYGAASLTF